MVSCNTLVFILIHKIIGYAEENSVNGMLRSSVFWCRFQDSFLFWYLSD
jgi:hypothetical protein